MSARKKIVNSEDIIGMGTSSKKWTKKEYNAIKTIINSKYAAQSIEEKIENQLISIKLRMQSYSSEESSQAPTSTGDFLKAIIKATGKKNKIFAKYIDLEESNLSSIISGRRKININLALKLEQIFGVNPSWWFEIQLKNEFLDLKKQKKKLNGKKYSLKGLLKKVI